MSNRTAALTGITLIIAIWSIQFLPKPSFDPSQVPEWDCIYGDYNPGNGIVECNSPPNSLREEGNE